LGAGHPRRKWSPENYAKLLQILSDDKSVFPILIGGPGEVKLGNVIQGLLNYEALNLVGGLNLNQLTALLSISEVVVTPDTGVMHMAAALDRKIVAIFGAGLVPFCRPLCSEYIIVKQELGCSGCNDICFTTGDAPCIALVTVDMVLIAVQALLLRKPMKKDEDWIINR